MYHISKSHIVTRVIYNKNKIFQKQFSFKYIYEMVESPSLVKSEVAELLYPKAWGWFN